MFLAINTYILVELTTCESTNKNICTQHAKATKSSITWGERRQKRRSPKRRRRQIL